MNFAVYFRREGRRFMGAACAMEQGDAFWLVYYAVGRACSCMLGSKLILPVPKRASVKVTSLLGRFRANKGSGSGGKIRKDAE
jgi:hypothetical protein